MKMPLVLHCSAAVLLLVMLYSPEKQGNEARAVTCCLETSKTMLRLDLLKGYKEQKTFLCPVHAIIFTTKKNINICSDPTAPWTIRAKKFLDKKKQPPVQPKDLPHHNPTRALKPEAQAQSNSTTTVNETSVFV
ncbi:C-C motif chemokine 8-like [Astyanax mexicanus]|uniref:C-C motif chemokine n=1 Tax=Astyanax mexicanus TaxID=7994 RepID=A0A8T2LSB2_ASTMX|nr:C-C motif chemokine 8-like [Astyanax mexicanus]